MSVVDVDVILGAPKIAEYLGTYPMRASRWLEAGTIRGERVSGRYWVARKADLDAFKASLPLKSRGRRAA